MTWVPYVIWQLSTSYFTHDSACMSTLLSPFAPQYSSPTVSTNPLSKSVSLFLPWKYIYQYHFSKSHSVQFSHSVMSNSLQPYQPQHARPPGLSPTPGVHPNPCPLNWWCPPTTSSSVIPFSSCPQSFPGSGSFQMSQLFASGGQSIGISASTSVLQMNTDPMNQMPWS